MGIAILFKNSRGTDPFGKNLRCLVSLAGEELILTSGYATLECKKLIAAIDSGFKDYEQSILITLAGNFGNRCANNNYKTNCNCHYHKYIKFVHYLSKSNASIKKFYIDDQGEWHAKVYIKVRENRPIAMIIGSSNLTWPAYTAGSRRECDVFIWDEEISCELSNIYDIPESEGFRVSAYYEGQEKDLLIKHYNNIKNYINNYKVSRIGNPN
ncbi:hypothetical protein JCM14036_14690 [Desulfotomaculum defluvii]